MIGLQLTHSGRYSHPNKPDVLESKTAYSHPLLDKKFGNDASNVVTDEEVGEIVRHFIKAAVIAQKAGFDFVDIKHAHGYLGDEFLTAYDRPGPYGGSFDNRTRFFREIAGHPESRAGTGTFRAHQHLRHSSVCERGGRRREADGMERRALSLCFRRGRLRYEDGP
ncbi:MAG: hypothetical protein V8T87_10550 [Victivallales bacterium]